jgi:hypothetical protein
MTLEDDMKDSQGFFNCTLFAGNKGCQNCRMHIGEKKVKAYSEQDTDCMLVLFKGMVKEMNKRMGK